MNKTIVKQSSPNLVGNPSVEFNKNGFEAAIWNKGYDITIEQAFECPCKNHENQPLTSCQNCLGTGWIFINPVQTKAIITSINKDTKYKSWSKELVGTVSITTMYDDPLSFMSRITLINSATIENRSIYSDVVKVRNLTNKPFVFLAYRPLEIIGVYAFQQTSLPLIKVPSNNYSISEDNPYILDFNYDFDDYIDDFNGFITVVYKHELQYHIIDIPHDVRNSYITNSDGQGEQITLPVNAYARKAQNMYEIANRDGSGIIDNSDASEVISLRYADVLGNSNVYNNNTNILRI